MGFFSMFGRNQEPVTTPTELRPTPDAGVEEPLLPPLITLGLDDQPAMDDLLEIKPYVAGLANFICGCPAPLTVAIQGDWGSGKTTTMRMVEREMIGKRNSPEGPVKVVRFNTWEHARAGSGEAIVAAMVAAILEDVPQTSEERRLLLVESLLRVGRAGLLGGVRGGLAAFTPAYVSAAAEGAMESVQQEFAAPEKKRDLRDDFRQLVADLHARVVVLVDDLDRLQPVQAVDVLEALKVYLDVPGCVFVLAVDFDVVVTGVRGKYPQIDERKARAFFDKIIQLPFHMPVQSYSMHKYLESALHEIRVPVSEVDLDVVVEVTGEAFGNNPRALKRLLNSFALLREIERLRDDDGAEDEDSGTTEGESIQRQRSTVLLCMLAIQSRYPDFYTHVGDPTWAERLKDEALPEEWGIDPAEQGAFRRVAKNLTDMLEGLPDRSEVVAKVVQITKVTQVSSASSQRPAPGDFVFDADSRRERLSGVLGDDSQVIDLGLHLEQAIRTALGTKPFSVVGQAGHGDEWTLASVSESEAAGGSRGRWGLVKFNKANLVLQLEGGRGTDLASWRQLEELSRQVAAKSGLRMGKVPEDKLAIRILGLATDEHVAAVAPLAAKAYALRIEGAVGI